MEVEEEEDESSGLEGMEFDAILDRKNGKGKGGGRGWGGTRQDCANYVTLLCRFVTNVFLMCS